MANHSYHHPRTRLQLQDFHHRTKMLLTEPERHHLFAVVKKFQTTRHLDRFVRELSHVLDTPTKLDLLKDIRRFVPVSLCHQYDLAAPYDLMVHPVSTSTQSRGRSGGRKLMSVSMQSSPTSMRHRLGMTEAPVGHPAPLKAITLVKDTEEQLGFSIRGGSEYGLGVFISDVEDDSAAERAGLRRGDNVIEVNSVSFENIASSSAIKVLIGCNRLRMIIRHIGKVPGFKSAKEKTSWFDVVQKCIVAGTLEEHGRLHTTVAIGYLEGHVNRHVNLTCRHEGEYLGFNIRGGCEYALGIYVSGVDSGGIAEQKGLKIGDQIMAVNGCGFEDMTHMDAVEVMKSDTRLVMTVKDVGLYPVFKEIYAEYRWIDVVSGAVTTSRTMGHITSVPVTEYSPQTTPKTVAAFSTIPLSIGSDNDDDDIINLDDDNDDMFDGTDSMDLFDHREESLQSHDSISANPVLQPRKDDLTMRDPGISREANGVKPSRDTTSKSPKPSRETRSKSPKSTIAVRAMENETRRSHPELAGLFDNGDTKEPATSDKLTAVDKKARGKSRTFRELIFGTRARGGKGKSATEGAHRKPRTRKALSAISFKSGGSKESDSVRNSPGIEEDNIVSERTPDIAPRLDGTTLTSLEFSAERVLKTDEVSAVLRHLNKYKKDGYVDGLVYPLTSIIDTPQKATLFNDIRTVLSDGDVARFDNLVARHLPSMTDRTRTPEMNDVTSDELQQVSNELHHIDRTSPSDLSSGPRYTRRNSKLYKAIIHDNADKSCEVDGDITLGRRSDAKRSDDRYNMFTLIEEDETGLPSMDTNPADGASSSVYHYSMTSVQSSAQSSPVNSATYQIDEPVYGGSSIGVENGYIDDLDISPVYETIGATKPVSLIVTPPSDDGDSRKFDSGEDYGSVMDALEYLDNLDLKSSHEDEDNLIVASPRSMDSDVTTFGRCSATYDVETTLSGSCDGNGEKYRSTSSTNATVDVNQRFSPDIDSGDSRAMSCSLSDLLRHPSPVFVPPPPPSHTPPSEEESEQIPGASMIVMQPDIVFVEPPQNVMYSVVRNSDTVDNTPHVASNDALSEECDSDTVSVSSSGQSSLQGELDFLDNADPPVVVLLDKTHRSLGISISGGRDSHTQPQVKVQKVFPGGAAHIEGTIRNDMSLLSVDGYSMDGVSHKEAVTIIRRSYMDKKNPILKMVLLNN